jgi:hypothetical protein
MTVAQLTVAWSSELAEGGEDPKQCEQNLGHILMVDIVNGRLDDSGPLVDGRRLGLRLVTPENKAAFIEGPQLLDLIRTKEVLHYVMVAKEAVLDFAQRHQLPPPSWWADSAGMPTAVPNDAAVTTVTRALGFGDMIQFRHARKFRSVVLSCDPAGKSGIKNGTTRP